METSLRGDAALALFDRFARILRARGTTINEETALLDLGCGSGHLLKAALARGTDAYGCDVDFDQPNYDQDLVAELRTAGRLMPIEVVRREQAAPRVVGKSPSTADFYRLPFDDGTFDVVISSQVLEHVENYPQLAGELYRVMKPGAVFLHFFPPPFHIIEGHTDIPFGGRFHPDWWLKLWIRAGVRRYGMSADEYLAWARDYLNTRVNYLTKSQLIEAFADKFDVEFVEAELFKINPRARIFLTPGLYRHFQSRILFGVRKN